MLKLVRVCVCVCMYGRVWPLPYLPMMRLTERHTCVPMGIHTGVILKNYYVQVCRLSACVDVWALYGVIRLIS